MTMTNKHTARIIYNQAFPYAWERAKRVALILFNEDENILAIKKGQDFDILRGFRDWDDDTLEDTARREAKDQASATLDNVTICAILSTSGALLSEVTCELVMTAFVKSQGPRSAWQETESTFIDTETFLSRYVASDREEIEVLISLAKDFQVQRKTNKRNDKTFQTQLFQTAQEPT